MIRRWGHWNARYEVLRRCKKVQNRFVVNARKRWSRLTVLCARCYVSLRCPWIPAYFLSTWVKAPLCCALLHAYAQSGKWITHENVIHISFILLQCAAIVAFLNISSAHLSFKSWGQDSMFSSWKLFEFSRILIHINLTLKRLLEYFCTMCAKG